MKYLINSNLNFAKHSLRILIPSLLECGIEPQNILVILGGSEENGEKFNFCGLYNSLNVKINAIDQTSFYTIKKYPHLFTEEYYYYMHDTTKVGPKFKSLSEHYFEYVKSKNINTMKNLASYSGNMGFYKKDFILKTLNEEEIYLKHESIMIDEIDSSNKEKLEKKKKAGFELEDKFFTRDMNISKGIIHVISKESPIFNKDLVDIYGTNTPRIVSYYKNLDLYKFGANGYVNENFKVFHGCKI